MSDDNKFNAGVMRGALAVIFSLALVAGFFMDKLTPDVFVPIAVVPITYYFARRQSNDETQEALAMVQAVNSAAQGAQQTERPVRKHSDNTFRELLTEPAPPRI